MIDMGLTHAERNAKYSKTPKGIRARERANLVYRAKQRKLKERQRIEKVQERVNGTGNPDLDAVIAEELEKERIENME